MKKTVLFTSLILSLFTFVDQAKAVEIDSCSMGHEFSNLTGERCSNVLKTTREDIRDRAYKDEPYKCLNFINDREISKLQDFLYRGGYYHSPSGANTAVKDISFLGDSIKKFQGSYGMKQNGHIDTTTRNQIRALTCGGVGNAVRFKDDSGDIFDAGATLSAEWEIMKNPVSAKILKDIKYEIRNLEKGFSATKSINIINSGTGSLPIPQNAPSGLYALLIYSTNDLSTFGVSDVFNIKGNANNAINVSLNNDRTINLHEPLQISLSLQDPYTNEYRIMIDWGDGKTSKYAEVIKDPSLNTGEYPHLYSKSGIYNIKIKVNDAKSKRSIEKMTTAKVLESNTPVEENKPTSSQKDSFSAIDSLRGCLFPNPVNSITGRPCQWTQAPSSVEKESSKINCDDDEVYFSGKTFNPSCPTRSEDAGMNYHEMVLKYLNKISEKEREKNKKPEAPNPLFLPTNLGYSLEKGGYDNVEFISRFNSPNKDSYMAYYQIQFSSEKTFGNPSKIVFDSKKMDEKYEAIAVGRLSGEENIKQYDHKLPNGGYLYLLFKRTVQTLFADNWRHEYLFWRIKFWDNTGWESGWSESGMIKNRLFRKE